MCVQLTGSYREISAVLLWKQVNRWKGSFTEGVLWRLVIRHLGSLIESWDDDDNAREVGRGKRGFSFSHSTF